MIAIAFLSILLAALLWQARRYYPLARREMMRERRMHAAESDDHTCDVCQRVAIDGAALCCVACADVRKFRAATLRQEAA